MAGKFKTTLSAPVLGIRPKPLGNAKRYYSSTTLDSEEYQRLYTELPFVAVLGMPRRSIYYRRLLDADEMVEETEEAGAFSMANGFTGSLAMASLLAMQSTFMFGYNTGVINAPVEVVFPGHTDLEWSCVVSIFCIGGLIGAYSGQYFIDTLGRRYGLLAAACVYLISGLIMALAMDIISLCFGRFFVGIAAGASTNFVPLYIGEIAPPHLRGVLGAICQFHLVFGILVADALAFPLATESGWRWLFGFTCVPALLQLLLCRWLLESPRYLLMKGVQRRAATILKELRGVDDVENEITSIVSASQNEAPAKEGGVLQNLGNPTVRFGLLIGIGLHLAQQLSGINAVFYYSNAFFLDMGLQNPLLGTTLVGFVNVLATVGAIFLIEPVGRRTLLLWSSAGMFLSTVMISGSLFAKDSYPDQAELLNYVALVAVMLFVMFFEIGLGPVAWLMVAEIFTAKLRSGAMSFCTLLNWSANFTVGLFYPLMVQAIGNYSWFPFSAVLLLTFVGSYFFVVETKDKTLEEIQEEITARAGGHRYGNEWQTPTVNTGGKKGDYGALRQNVVGSVN